MARGGKRPGAGRPKANHTIEAEALKAYLIERVRAEQEAIIDALIGQAKAGDIRAIQEALNRTLGKPKESVELSGNIQVEGVEISVRK